MVKLFLASPKNSRIRRGYLDVRHKGRRRNGRPTIALHTWNSTKAAAAVDLVRALAVKLYLPKTAQRLHNVCTRYKVYNIKPDLEQERLDPLKSDLIDFWRRPNFKYNVIGRAMVPPSHFNWFEEKLEELSIDKDVYIEDVYEYLAEKDTVRIGSRNEDGTFDIRRYHRYNDILNYLNTLPDQYANTTTRIEIIQHGVTEQNRPLVYLKVSSNNTSEKPVIIIEAGINPREWITIPAALYVLEGILEEQRYLDEFEWIVIPVLNPDGYEYTHTNLRLWTKSRSTRSNMDAICPGVNINRNLDIDWLHFDSSSSPCSHLYGGVEPFSEIESQLIRNVIQGHGPRIRMYISLQNNGGYITYPWSYERAASGMFRQNHLLGLEMIRTMNETYNIDVSSVVFDRASGTSSDYARTNGVLYTYNIDVVEKGDGVIIPEAEIGGIVDDVWRAVAAAADQMIRLNLYI